MTKSQLLLVDVLKAEAEPPGVDFCVLPTEVNFGDGGRVKYIQVTTTNHWSTIIEDWSTFTEHWSTFIKHWSTFIEHWSTFREHCSTFIEH